MSAVDDLSPVARHALWASCMDSNVPVQLSDPATVERVTALLRSGSPTNSEAGTYSVPAPLRHHNTIGSERPAKNAPDDTPPNGESL